MAKLLLFLCLLCIAPVTVQADFDGRVLVPPGEVKLPIIMYHLVTESPKYIGKYGITPAQLEADLIYLKENGYTTVVMEDVLNFVSNSIPLPEKPILLSFDDGNYSDYQYLLPLLKKHDMKAVAAIIGEAANRCGAILADSPKAKVPNMGWEEIKAIHQSGHIEVVSHGYNVHGAGGSGNKKGESPEAYRHRLSEDLERLQQDFETHLGHRPVTFVYPLGVVGKGSRQIIEGVGLQATFGCEEGVNVLTPGDREGLFTMYRYNRPSSRSVGEILGRIG